MTITVIIVWFLYLSRSVKNIQDPQRSKSSSPNKYSPKDQKKTFCVTIVIQLDMSVVMQIAQREEDRANFVQIKVTAHKCRTKLPSDYQNRLSQIGKL